MITLGLLWGWEGHACVWEKGESNAGGGGGCCLRLPATRKGIAKTKVQGLVLAPQHPRLPLSTPGTT